MSYRVELVYFRPTGKFLTRAETVIVRDALPQIWEEIRELRRLGQLPGLRLNAGRDLCIVVDVPDHPQRVPHLLMPPFVDEDDVTPPRGVLEEAPVVRVPLEELPRTSTRDVVRVDLDADAEADTVVVSPDDEGSITPVEIPIPKPIDDE